METKNEISQFTFHRVLRETEMNFYFEEKLFPFYIIANIVWYIRVSITSSLLLVHFRVALVSLVRRLSINWDPADAREREVRAINAGRCPNFLAIPLLIGPVKTFINVSSGDSPEGIARQRKRIVLSRLFFYSSRNASLPAINLFEFN